jgi:hypothetical protein
VAGDLEQMQFTHYFINNSKFKSTNQHCRKSEFGIAAVLSRFKFSLDFLGETEASRLI